MQCGISYPGFLGTHNTTAFVCSNPYAPGNDYHSIKSARMNGSGYQEVLLEEISTSLATPFAISVWFKIDDWTGKNQTIVNIVPERQASIYNLKPMRIFVGSDSKLLECDNGDWPMPFTKTITPGKWYHLVIQRNDYNPYETPEMPHFDLYLNGELCLEKELFYGMVANPRGKLYFGGTIADPYWQPQDEWLKGKVSNIAIFHNPSETTPLTHAEVTALYNNRETDLWGKTSFLLNQTTGGETIADISPYNHQITKSGNVLYSSSSKYGDNGTYFGGVKQTETETEEYITKTKESNTDPANPYEWIVDEVIGADGTFKIIDMWANYLGSAHDVSSQFEFEILINGAPASSDNFPYGPVQFYITSRWYGNWRWNEPGKWRGNFGWLAPDGARNHGIYIANVFEGDHIQARFTARPGYNTQTLYSMNLKWVVPGGEATSTPEDSLQIPHHDSLDPAGKDFVVDGWVKTDDVNDGYVAGKAMTSGNNQGWRLSQESGKLNLTVADAQQTVSVKSTTSVNDDNWHHFAGMIDIDKKVTKMFIDGTQEGIAALATDDGLAQVRQYGGCPDPIYPPFGPYPNSAWITGNQFCTDMYSSNIRVGDIMPNHIDGRDLTIKQIDTYLGSYAGAPATPPGMGCWVITAYKNAQLIGDWVKNIDIAMSNWRYNTVDIVIPTVTRDDTIQIFTEWRQSDCVTTASYAGLRMGVLYESPNAASVGSIGGNSNLTLGNWNSVSGWKGSLEDFRILKDTVYCTSGYKTLPIPVEKIHAGMAQPISLSGEVVNDNSWDDVALFLKTGDCPQQSLYDLSKHNNTITQYNNVHIDTTEWKFDGIAPIKFTSRSTSWDPYNGDYLTVPHHNDLDLNGDRTIEFWMKCGQQERHPVTEVNYILAKSQRTNVEYHGWSIGVGSILAVNTPEENRGRMTFSSWTGSNWGYGSKPSWGFESQARVDDDKWHHIAFVYESGENDAGGNYRYGVWELYVDGILDCSSGCPGPRFDVANTNDLWVGCGPDYYTDHPRYFYTGHLDQLRITTSRRYTSNFTPPMRPFSGNLDTSLVSRGDPYWDDVFFRHTFDGPSANDDKSTNSHTVYSHGNAKLVGNIKRFGDASAYFDGSGDCFHIATGDTFLGGTGAHTVELWFRTSSTGYQYLVCRNSNQNYGGLFIHPAATTNNIGWGGNAGSFLYATATINMDTWYHIAVVADDSANASILLNGVEVATTASRAVWSFSTASDNISFGSQHYTSSLLRYVLNGYMDDIRITKGVARVITPFNYNRVLPIGKADTWNASWFPLSGDGREAISNSTGKIAQTSVTYSNDVP